MQTASEMRRLGSAVLAVAVFALLLTMPGIAADAVRDGFLLAAAASSGGALDAAASDGVHAFLSEHINFYSALVYLVFGVPVLAWAIAMGHRARSRRTAERGPEAPTPPHAGGEPAGEGRRSAPSVRVRGVDARYFMSAVLVGFGMQFVTILLMVVVDALLPRAMHEYNSLVEASGVTSYGVAWAVSTLILPPIVEETGFRGLGMTYLERAGLPFWAANAIQALAFGLFHMNLVQGAYTFLLGALFGYLAHRSGSLAPAMLAHLTYNLMGTIGTEAVYAFVPAPFTFLCVAGAAALVLASRLLKGAAGAPGRRGAQRRARAR